MTNENIIEIKKIKEINDRDRILMGYSMTSFFAFIFIICVAIIGDITIHPSIYILLIPSMVYTLIMFGKIMVADLSELSHTVITIEIERKKEN